MFDITSTKLLILGVVALLVVGPHELPGLLRTIGKYMGMIKRQAAEFRSQFDEAMRETEFADLKKEIETISKDAESTMREAERNLETHVSDVKQQVDQTMGDIAAPQPAPPQPTTITEAQAIAHEPAIETASTVSADTTAHPLPPLEETTPLKSGT
jgi:sec-independent protein translocase protein TatB